LYNALANHPDFANLDHSDLRVSNGGGMAVQQAVADRWLEDSPGCPICEGYGLSETSPSAVCNPSDTDAYSGMVGDAPALDRGLYYSMTTSSEELPLSRGSAGEIAIRGPQMSSAGCWNRAGRSPRG